MIYYPEDENPNAATEEATTHESNAVVNNEGGTSETPSNLVGFNFQPGDIVTQEELDRILSYNKDSLGESKLTPNPAGFGFTGQEFVDSLPLVANAKPNVLYCLKVKNDNILVGYKLYKFFLTPTGGIFAQFGATPDLQLKDGVREQEPVVGNEPREIPERVFTGVVVFGQEPIINGKLLSEYIDYKGGVTQAELNAAVAILNQKIDTKQDILNTTSAPSGSAAKILGFDSEGHLVNDDVPEGIVVDDSIVEDSSNAVAGGAVYDALHDIIADEYDSTKTYNTGDVVLYDNVLYACKEDDVTGSWNSAKWQATNIVKEIDGVVKDLEDGKTIVGHAEEADSLTTKTGKLDATPFAFEPSGGQTDIETGYQKTLKLVGCNLVKNQLLNPRTWSYTFTTELNQSYAQFENVFGEYSCINGHIYIFYANCSRTMTGNNQVQFKLFANNSPCSLNFANGEANGTKLAIFTATSNLTNNRLSLNNYEGKQKFDVDDTFSINNAGFVDLTQLLGSNDVVNAIIGNDTSTQVTKLMQFLGGKLPTTYNTGSFSETISKYVKSVGRQQWDEIGAGYSIANNIGQPLSRTSGSYFGNTNPITVVPNKTYYFYKPNYVAYIYEYDENGYLIKGYTTLGMYQHTFTTDIRTKNIYYLLASDYGTTYNHDITISIYYEGESGYDQYYPYEEHIDELPNIQLNGILKVDGSGNVYADGDELYPDGVGNARRYGSYTLTGNESWVAWGSGYVASNVLTESALANNDKKNAISTFALSISNNDIYSGTSSGFGLNAKNIYITADIYANVSSLTGKTIYYELATPTELTANTFNPNLYADDFGTLQFLDEDSNEVAGLQGNEIFYKANIAGFAESLYIRTGGEPSDVVIQEDLQPFSAKDTQLLNAIGGTLRQCLCVKESLDFDNTDFVDLGTLDWTYFNDRFSAGGFSIKIGTNKIICSKYKALESGYSTSHDEDKTCWSKLDVSGLWVQDSSYTDATAFKAAMKGVLLAYEKASE